MSTPEAPFQVPTELEKHITPEVMAVHERWQHVKTSDLTKMIDRSVQLVDLDDRYVRVGVVGENADGPKVVLGLPHQQRFKPAMAIRAKVLQEIVVPDGQVIVLPNNGRQTEYYGFTATERRKLLRGNSRPYGELQARTLEALDVGCVALSGNSFGGFGMLAIAEVVPNFDITHLNADEAPSKENRDAKELGSDFVKSGGFGDQLEAIADSGIPVLGEVYSRARLAADYARFGVVAFLNLNPDNGALHEVMAGSLDAKVASVRENYPNAKIKLGHVEGSKLFVPESIKQPKGDNLRIQQYTGEGARRHTTADNPMAHALMVVDGIGRP